VERLRKQVRAHIHEARQSVLELRSPVLETTALDALLRDVGGRMTGNQPVRFEVAVHGRQPSPIPKDVKAQLFRIGQEALSNAVRHAGASLIRTEIHYRQDAVTLRVVDDGRGFDRRTADGCALNHWGLTSMEERAQQVGGEFRIQTEPGGGTTVEVRAPLDARRVAHA
jgi:signal transduction histidine kinase